MGLTRWLQTLTVSTGSDPATASPYLPSGREMQRYLAAVLVCALPCLALASHYLGRRVWLLLAVTAAGSGLVELVVARARRRPLSGGALAYAALLVLLLPADIPLWMAALGSMVGILFGREVFGGTGHSIFHPVLVSKGFLLFSYPQEIQGIHMASMAGYEGAPEAWLLCAGAIAVSALGFALARPANLHLLAAILLGAIGVAFPLAEAGHLPLDSVLELVAGDGMLFGAIFLASDPSSSPRDDRCKWLVGLLVGVTAVLMRCFSTYSEAMLSALLVGNLVSPLLDTLVLPAPAAPPPGSPAATSGRAA